MELHVEGERDLWLHLPDTDGQRRAPLAMQLRAGRVDIALDASRLKGGPVELTDSPARGEGRVLVGEQLTPGSRVWRISTGR